MALDPNFTHRLNSIERKGDDADIIHLQDAIDAMAERATGILELLKLQFQAEDALVCSHHVIRSALDAAICELNDILATVEDFGWDIEDPRKPTHPTYQ